MSDTATRTREAIEHDLPDSNAIAQTVSGDKYEAEHRRLNQLLDELARVR